MSGPRRAPRGRLYEAIDGFAIRAPLLPVAASAATTASDGDAVAPGDPRVAAAVAVAAPDLAASLASTSPASPRAPRLRRALLRYGIRMATRPTPFGLFAGIGVGTWGPATDLALGDRRPVSARVDMAWLMGAVRDLEARPEIRRRLRLVANTCAIVRDGRAFLADAGTAGWTPPADVSVRATAAVTAALALARRPIQYEELAAALLDRPGATPERVSALLDDLWRQGLLLTDLVPPVTAAPLPTVAARLRAAGADAEAARLEQVQEAVDDVAATAAAATAAAAAPRAAGAVVRALARVGERARALHAADGDVVAVDSGLPLQSTRLSARVAAEAVRAVELLLRLHPAPGGPAALAGYRSAFLARYGHDRLVSVPELLDPRFGLGPPAAHVHGAGPPRLAGDPAERDATLRELAASALRDGRDEVELDEPLLEALSLWRPTVADVPASLELSAFVAAASPAAIDRGDFRLVVGPNLGAQAAGRGLGRFADLLGASATALLDDAARREQALQPDALFAELVYLPGTLRAANVTVRPAVRRHEVVVGAGAGVAPDAVVPVDELAVGVRGDRFCLWWPARGREVVVCSGHMLNTRGAPAVCRLLAELSLDGVTPLSDFDWGPAAGLPALPRVRVGRVVLRPAEWRQRRASAVRELDVDDAGRFADALPVWRARRRIPRHVYLAAGDNRLLLDLDDPACADVLRAELRRDDPWDLLLQEALPGPGDAWLPGPGGGYASEVVVPLVRVRTDASAVPAAPRPAALVVHPESRRRRPPGSDWLFVTLHGPRDGDDALIAGPLRAFADGLVADGLVDAWWYLRYADPHPHLRLRLHGRPQVLCEAVLPAAARWAGDLIARGLRTRFGVEVYEREVERYGGEEGVAVAEALFAADSVAAAALLAACRAGEGPADLVEVATLSVDDLLASLGFDTDSRRAWYHRHAGPPQESAEVYRQRNARLRRLVAEPFVLDEVAPAVVAALAARRTALVPLGERLAALERDGVLGVPLTDVARSYVHLHANRLLGVDAARERLVLGLLRRTTASLAAAPLAPAPGSAG